MAGNIGSGLSSQLGVKAESVYGTGVTVDRFIEFNSESLEAEVVHLMTRGLGQRFQRTSRVRTYIKRGQGQVAFDIMNVGHGMFFRQLLGGVSTAHPGTEYVHTFTPDATGKAGVSMTIQKGVPDITGTVRPFTFPGSKVLEGTLTAELDANLTLALTIDSATATTGTALASESINANAVPLSFIDGSATIGGGSVDIVSFAVTVKDAQDVDRRFIGNTRKEPIANGEMEITGTLTMEFASLAQYALFVAGTEIEDLILTFAYGDTGAAVPFKLVITIASLKYTGETPKVGSSEVVKQALPFKALYNGTDPIISIAYTTTDALP